MSYIYLFETKSIQSYLGRTGNLRDLIAISDKLDNFIDDSNDCILGKVLQTLHETYPDDPINFIRRRGGSFYSYSKNESALSNFRKLWLLVFYQYFPYMQHTDYFGEISDDSSKFKEEISKAFKKLNASANLAELQLPYSTIAVEPNKSTGMPAVDYERDLASSTLKSIIDSDDESVSQRIYQKFIHPQKGVDKQDSRYKLLIGKFIRDFNRYQNTGSDIAYLHFDGNGIGQTIIKIRDAQSNLDDYTKTMKNFSKSLSESTQEAAQYAFSEVYQKVQNEGKETFIFRPLVLGGDDLTLMIEPKYAFEYCVKYTKKFKELTQKKLCASIDKKILNTLESSVKDGLTASGGILFNKIKHPVSNTGAIVEGLASKAKDLTKNKDGLQELSQFKGRSAVAFYRMSTSSQESFDTIMSRSRTFKCRIPGTEIEQFSLGGGVYFIDSDIEYPNISNFMKFLERHKEINPKNKDYSSVISTFRKMMTSLSRNDFYEAKRNYEMLRNKVNSDIKNELYKLFTLTDSKNHQSDNFEVNDNFYYRVVDADNKTLYLESPLADLLVIYHFMYADSDCDEQIAADSNGI